MNTEELLDLADLEPTDDEILEVEDDLEEDEADEDLDFSYSATDDRYEGNGVPIWSAWA